MDLNHDKQIQSLLCYRYTIRQTVCGIFIESDFGVKPSGRVFSGAISLLSERGHSCPSWR